MIEEGFLAAIFIVYDIWFVLILPHPLNIALLIWLACITCFIIYILSKKHHRTEPEMSKLQSFNHSAKNELHIV